MDKMNDKHLVLVCGFENDRILDFVSRIEVNKSKKPISISIFPENSKHPRAQSSFIKDLIDQNDQLLIATHSEFVLNEIRIAVVEKRLKTEFVNVVFIGGCDSYEPIIIESDGSIKNWCEGFFDHQTQQIIQIFNAKIVN